MLYASLVASAVQGGRKTSSGYVRVNCPVCVYRTGKADRKACLGYNPNNRWWSCWRCNAKGRLSGDDLDMLPWQPEPEEETPKPPPLTLPEEHCLLSEEPARSSFAFTRARSYIEKRLGKYTSNPNALCALLRVGACVSGRFTGRVILPVYEGTTLRWFVGRTWSASSELPYLYPRGAREGVIFNRAALDVETDVPVLVTEGWFDAAAHYPNAVAVLGKTTEAHLKMLAQAKRPVVLCPDGDAFDEGLVQSQGLRFRGVKAGCIRLPPRVDPDEVDAVELMAAAHAAVHAGRYVAIE